MRAPYVDPVVLTDVPEDSDALTQETFGPVIVINRVASMGEAVEKANACAYGLGAAVYSRTRGPAIARRLRTGMVSVNSVLAFAGVPGLPFGGTGASGFGRVHGPEGLREFSRTQSVTRQRIRPLLQPLSFRRTPARWTSSCVSSGPCTAEPRFASHDENTGVDVGIPNETDVLIVGSGPAGALLGCLLARRGIDVLVVEKQPDFERDFRGKASPRHR
ncbi:aldehyde dehydrogenase family protein [Streptomyces stramineus]